MNRKQKKNKQRIAREHTKKQAKIELTPHEKQAVQTWNDQQNEWYAMVEEELKPSGLVIRVWHVLAALVIGVLIWLIG